MFFKKPVVLKFITYDKDSYAFAKPDKATKFFPDWWKELARNHKNHERQDMTYCNGFVDLYKKSIIVPAWSHFKATIGHDFYQWKYIDGKSEAIAHAKEQRGSLFAEYQHLKLMCPWQMECDEDVFVSWQEPVYSQTLEGMKVLSGLTQPKYMNLININMMFKREQEIQQYEFDLGYPLVQLLPLTEREVKIEHLLVTKQEYADRESLTYQSKFAQHNKAVKVQQKCPFWGEK